MRSDLTGKLGRHMHSAIEKELIGLSIAREEIATEGNLGRQYRWGRP